MNYHLFLAVRHLKGKGGKSLTPFSTIISMTGVALGVMAIILVMGVMSGFDEELQERILGFKAHILIQSLTKFSYPFPQEEKISSQQEVRSVSPVIWGEGILKNPYSGRYSRGVIVKGILLNREIENLKKYLPMDIKDLKPGETVIGKELAKALGLKEGDTFFLLSPALNMESFTLKGFLESGIYQYDNSLVLLPLSSAQQLFQMPGYISGIEIKLKNPYQAKEFKSKIKKILPSFYVVKTWQEMEKTFFQALRLEKITMFTILSLIVLVATFNIAGSLSMRVIEKKREIGILRAIGFTTSDIRKIFLWEGLTIGCIGSITGGLIAGILEVILKFKKPISLPQEIYNLSYLPVKIEPLMFLLVMTLAFVITLLATLYPAIKASRLQVGEILRYE